jgi:hypothetical protein
MEYCSCLVVILNVSLRIVWIAHDDFFRTCLKKEKKLFWLILHKRVDLVQELLSRLIKLKGFDNNIFTKFQEYPTSTGFVFTKCSRCINL